jgi:hypothetical protein
LEQARLLGYSDQSLTRARPDFRDCSSIRAFFCLSFSVPCLSCRMFRHSLQTVREIEKGDLAGWQAQLIVYHSDPGTSARSMRSQFRVTMGTQSTCFGHVKTFPLRTSPLTSPRLKRTWVGGPSTGIQTRLRCCTRTCAAVLSSILTKSAS